MNFRARRILIRGVASVVVGAALATSVVLAGGAVPEAENDAKQLAEDYANSVLYKALTPDMIGQPIDGNDYGSVLLQVQAGVLKDDDVVRVRVWNGSGILVFSSDQRDRLGQQAGIGSVLGKVLDGSTVTDVTGRRVAPEPGLAGANDRLFLSYVPLRLGSDTLPSAAVEIDQHYSAILAAAYRIWRPLQIGLGVILVFALGMLIAAFRSRTVWSGSGLADDRRASERLRSLEKQMRELERHAREADDRAKQADDRVRAAEERADATTKAKTALEEQFESAEGNLRDALSAAETSREGVAALSARVPELEREVAELRARAAASESVVTGVSAEEFSTVETRAREAEAERDRFAREVEQLNIAMSESNAAYNRATELEMRLAEVQARALGSEQRLADADRRLAEIEQRSKSSVDQARVDLDRISIRPSETQAALAESTDKMTKLQSDLQRVQQEKDDAVVELQRAGLATGERHQEVERLRAAITERDQQLQDLQRIVLERNAELEELRSGLGERSGEAEHARAETAAKAAELDQLRAEAVAKNAELDALRGDAASRAAELDRLRADLTARTAELEALRNDSTSRSSEAASLRAELSLRTAELDEVRQDLSARSEELARLRDAVAGRDAELQRVRAELEEAAAQPTAAASEEADGDELRRRVGELEDLRRTDIADVQQAHEQLANAQLELRQARERIEDLEDRARKFAAAGVEAGIPFQQAGNGAYAEPEFAAGEAVTSPDSPVFEPPDEATVGSRLSAFRKRRVSSRIEDVPVPNEQWEPPVIGEPDDEAEEHHDDPPMPEITPEGLSLRERLTRAAAARHRVTTPSDAEHR